jgi:hypothetical protein
MGLTEEQKSTLTILGVGAVSFLGGAGKKLSSEKKFSYFKIFFKS